jgi:predicted DsbA family dithiol-disulfide isomerase
MLSIEIFSDVICPWCFIGKRRLDNALTATVGEGVSLRWRPYMLYPNIPPSGWDRLEFLQRRYGANADKARIPERLQQEADDVGIELRYDLIQRTPNTLMAHRLIDWFFDQSTIEHRSPEGNGQGGVSDLSGRTAELASKVQLAQHHIAEVLFQGYFCRGLNIGDVDVLVDLAAEAGAKIEGLRAFLVSNRGTDAVNEQLARAPDLGIAGVPGYWLGGGFLLPGAQSEETISKIVTRAKVRFAD